MKPATFSPFYASLYPMLCEIARENGYGLAIHGTLVNDLDLVAIPWIETPVSPDELIKTVAEYLHIFWDTRKADGWVETIPEEKPHGRITWKIPTGYGTAIDFSIMPTI